MLVGARQNPAHADDLGDGAGRRPGQHGARRDRAPWAAEAGDKPGTDTPPSMQRCPVVTLSTLEVEYITL